MSKTKLYKNEEHITYKILSYMTVLVTAKKTKNRIRQRSKVHFLIYF